MDPTFDPYVTDDLKADPVAWPILEKMPEKSVTEVLKGYAHSQHRLGSSVTLPNGKPEDVAKWQAEHLPKLQQAGLIPTPTKPPDNYEIKLPEGVPVDAWGEADTELAQGFAKKHGLSQEALNDGLSILASVLGKYGATVQVNRDAAVAEIARWATQEEKTTVEQVNAALERFQSDPRTGWDDATKQAMADRGEADNPLVVKAIYKIMKDSGMFDTRNDEGSGGTPTPDAAAARAEADAIIRDKNNPKYALYHKGDPDTNAYVQQLLKKGVPGTLEI